MYLKMYGLAPQKRKRYRLYPQIKSAHEILQKEIWTLNSVYK